MTRTTAGIGTAVVVLGLVAGFTLGRWSLRPRDGRSEGPTIARMRGEALRDADVRAALRDRAFTEPSGGLADARRVVEELARTRVLAARAVAKGYDREPDLARRHAEQLAAVYLERELEAGDAAPTAEDVRAWFEAHRGELARPERARVALVSFTASSSESRDAKRAKATAALRDARARDGEYYAFGELARARSEDPRTAARLGELGELTRDDLAAAAGPEVAAAAFSHSGPGLHDAVVETATGFHVVKVLGREAAYEPRLEDVADAVRARIARERREARRAALLEAAAKDADVRVDDAALEKLVAEVEAKR